MIERSRSLQIYMKPGVKEDDLLLRVWESCRRHDRPQDVFRSMLRAGLLAIVESGEMPESVIEECGLESLLERRRRRLGTSAAHAQGPFMPPHYPSWPLPQAHPPSAPWAAGQPPHGHGTAPAPAAGEQAPGTGGRPAQTAERADAAPARPAPPAPSGKPEKPRDGRRIGDLM